MKRYKLIEMTAGEVDAIAWKLKKDSAWFRDDIWPCGCTRYTPGRCECGNMAWLVHIDGKPVGAVDVAVKPPLPALGTCVKGRE